MNLEKEMDEQIYAVENDGMLHYEIAIKVAKQYAEEIRQETIKDCIKVANEVPLMDEHEYVRKYIVFEVGALMLLATEEK